MKLNVVPHNFKPDCEKIRKLKLWSVKEIFAENIYQSLNFECLNNATDKSIALSIQTEKSLITTLTDTKAFKLYNAQSIEVQTKPSF